MGGRRSGSGGPKGSAPSLIASVLGASNAWDAEHLTVSTTTDAWVATAGGVNLAVQTAAQPAPAAVAALRGRRAVTWSGAGAYAAAITAPGDNQTFMFVGYAGGANFGMMALTAAGALNTGSSLFFDGTAGGTVFGRRLAVDATVLRAAPMAFVLVCTKTTAGESLYVNSRTPVASAVGTASFSQAQFILGALTSTNVYAFAGNTVAAAAIYNRVLSAAEINYALTQAGAYYGVSIA